MDTQDLSGCKHGPATPCGDTCECWCAPCQDIYEARWTAEVSSKGLCADCGFPTERPMTLAAVEAERHTHFFIPCRDCMGPYKALVESLKLCFGCHKPLNEKGECSTCAEALKAQEASQGSQAE